MNFKNLIFIILTAAMVMCAIGKNARAQTIKPEDITEIVFEESGGHCFDCDEKTTLRADGAATRRGGRYANVFKGDYVGRIGAERFAELAREIAAAGFFDLNDLYKGDAEDAEAIRITVVYPGGKKAVVSSGLSQEARVESVKRLVHNAALKTKWRSIGVTEIADDASLAEIGRVVEKKENWTADNVELIAAFGKLRARLGARFEPEMWKYLGKDLERHYWIAYYVEEAGDAESLRLALRVRENALRVVGRKTDELSLINRMTFGVCAAIGSRKLDLLDKAIEHKTAVEILRAKPPEFPGFPALFDDDLKIYESIPVKRR